MASPLLILLALLGPASEAVGEPAETVSAPIVAPLPIDERATLRATKGGLRMARKLRRKAEAEAQEWSVHVPQIQWTVPWVPLDAREARQVPGPNNGIR